MDVKMCNRSGSRHPITNEIAHTIQHCGSNHVFNIQKIKTSLFLLALCVMSNFNFENCIKRNLRFHFSLFVCFFNWKQCNEIYKKISNLFHVINS